mgnify:CR=1 FL=1
MLTVKDGEYPNIDISLEKEAEELPEKTGDKEEYTAFVNKTLKQFGVKSPAELKGDERKRFYDALDAGCCLLYTSDAADE